MQRAEETLHDLAVGGVEFQLAGNKFCLQTRDDILRLRLGIIDRREFVCLGVLGMAAHNEEVGHGQDE